MLLQWQLEYHPQKLNHHRLTSHLRRSVTHLQNIGGKLKNDLIEWQRVNWRYTTRITAIDQNETC